MSCLDVEGLKLLLLEEGEGIWFCPDADGSGALAVPLGGAELMLFCVDVGGFELLDLLLDEGKRLLF